MLDAYRSRRTGLQTIAAWTSRQIRAQLDAVRDSVVKYPKRFRENGFAVALDGRAERLDRLLSRKRRMP
jgi:hypothetical protein